MEVLSHSSQRAAEAVQVDIPPALASLAVPVDRPLPRLTQADVMGESNARNSTPDPYDTEGFSTTGDSSIDHVWESVRCAL
jgi:hypothetical protein